MNKSGVSMFNSRWVFLAVLTSFSTFGAVSFEEKQLRVDSLMELQKNAPAVTFEAYRRELGYEQRGLSIEARSKNETNLLAEKMRDQIHSAFQAAMKEHNSTELAREEVREAIERDLEQASPELKEELLNYANSTLDNAEYGGVSEEADLSNVEVVLQKEVVNRKEFLNAEDPALGGDPITPKANTSKDSERKEYASKQELMESLVSDRESSRWVSTAGQTVKTAQVTKAETKISMQVKMEFLGAEIEAGPSISFKREIATDAVLTTEGLNPVIMRDGTFDRFKRDRDNKVIYKNGKAVTRYVSMTCDVDLKFETEYQGSGGFKYMGMGADVSVSSVFQNVVNLQSRRIALPEVVAGKTLTVKSVSQICHGDFLKAKATNSMTVRQSLDIMMRNVVSGLVFSNPKTKCAKDSDCANWFNKEVISLKKRKNTYRCVEDTRDKFRFCQLRGQAGQNCSVFEGGKRTSSGQNEYPCDKGLKCVKKSDASQVLGYDWSYSVGKCQK
jgi:hypothetical protein